LHYNLPMTATRTVVFVCQHGAAKSVLAATLLERLAAEQGLPLRALARGTEPSPLVKARAQLPAGHRCCPLLSPASCPKYAPRAPSTPAALGLR